MNIVNIPTNGLPGILKNEGNFIAGKILGAGTVNTLNGIWGAANLVAKLTGAKSFRQNDGYSPTAWGSGLGVQQLLMVKTNIGGYFFDAVFTVDTEHSLTITQHPVQTGANISDHAFVNPIRMSMQVGVSDAMAYRIGADYGGDGGTKSVQAYRLLCKLQELRTPMQVVTRLNTYNNMLIESIDVSDDVSTLCALKATVNLVQVLVVNVGTEKVSARAWTTDSSRKPPQEIQPKGDNSTILRKFEKGTGLGVTW
ncbi:MAG: hypothetical protein SPI35_08100 [Porphyromonas sp.]|nr:hypothetical protein [Porphyromonas sp.]